MREKRRLKLMKRQATLAKIARREAMMSLAGTLDEESKSAALAKRSRELASDYGQRPVIGLAADLYQLSTIAGGLAILAKEAESARKDAREQADWQIGELARSEERLKRLEQRAKQAQQALKQANSDRNAPIASRVARKLLKSSDNTDPKLSRKSQ